MLPDILVVRNGAHYRLLHGHLHLCNALTGQDETLAYASGEGEVKIVKAENELRVEQQGFKFPLVQSHEHCPA